MPASQSLVDRTFSSWFVLADGPIRIGSDGHRRRYSWCRCQCGLEKFVRNQHLIDGESRSCRPCAMRTHGQSGVGKSATNRTRIYVLWLDMKQRCANPNNTGHKNYGGRGITVCERWMAFENYFEDVGVGKAGWTVERVDNSRGYEPENICWATRKQQNRNKRSNFVLTVSGITACLADLCDRFHAPYARTWKRLRMYGWSPERAFFT